MGLLFFMSTKAYAIINQFKYEHTFKNPHSNFIMNHMGDGHPLLTDFTNKYHWLQDIIFFVSITFRDSELYWQE